MNPCARRERCERRVCLSHQQNRRAGCLGKGQGAALIGKPCPSGKRALGDGKPLVQLGVGLSAGLCSAPYPAVQTALLQARRDVPMDLLVEAARTDGSCHVLHQEAFDGDA